MLACEEKIKALRSALQGTDAEPIRRAMDDLSQTLQKIGAAVYQQAGATPPPPGGAPEGPPPGGGPEPKPPEGTVEGEYREV